ncbi:3'(2'),5'-bisphosphate nucleotidase CysQ [Pseudohongiella nitratireducens]|mgnify:CR=1 FL=1|uniref:3'(2'),5'-bisphosphate nucleotidase CysQ n=1 Tax=Pseudohongiella nitratireducens TaxID=1768907 RepID=A0A916QKW3_9GAMM|nr:3'(2'),5'-bisphosphate nucleotidase CysQ [Pseudohongiella nitratireducens]GFZ77023.1 3'(2'),5'-bisphosphate nucleotidase CysQ [Pseudohongiella nitratireducens]
MTEVTDKTAIETSIETAIETAMTRNPVEMQAALIEVARDAGQVIMDIYNTDFEVRGKSDDSPVTEADEKAEAVIIEALRELAPEIPIIAEEAVAAGKTEQIAERFWLVDPLDGTREFINRNGEFTVNIALIENGQPILGVVYAPAIDRLFAGCVGHGAQVIEAGEVRDIQIRDIPAEGLTVVASRSHGDPEALKQFLGDQKVAEVRNAGSSLKICLVAAGEADLYPRLGRTMEWDIAAGHAVLRAAGGRLTNLERQDLGYGKAGFENPHFLAFGAL